MVQVFEVRALLEAVSGRAKVLGELFVEPSVLKDLLRGRSLKRVHPKHRLCQVFSLSADVSLVYELDKVVLTV